MEPKRKFQDMSESKEGNTVQTERSKRTAVSRHFNSFLMEQDLPNFDQLTESQLCNVTLFGEFADYLINAVKGNGESLKGGSALQILGRVRTKAAEKFPQNPIWNDYSSKWYSKITYNVTKLNSRRCNVTGEAIEDKAPPVGRYLMKRIMMTLLSLMKSTSPPKTKMFIYRRLVFLIQYLAVGRCSECAHATWNRTKWYMDVELLWMNWNEKKVGLQKPMTFTCDAECLEMDIFHAFGCYFMFDCGRLPADNVLTPDEEGTNKNRKENFIFPDLHAKVNPASTIDKWLKDLIPRNNAADDWCSRDSLRPQMGFDEDKTVNPHVNGRVVGLYRDTTMTSFRCGPVMECLASKYCTENDINQRGGWTEDGGPKVAGSQATRMAKYIRPSDYNVMRAGLVLSGFKIDARDGVAYAPKVNSFWYKNPDNPKLATALKAELFKYPSHIMDTAELAEFGWVMLASQLMYYETIYDTYGQYHPIVLKMEAASGKVGVSKAMLKSWGNDVKEKWKEENFPTITDKEANYVADAHEINVKLRKLDEIKLMLQQRPDRISTSSTSIATSPSEGNNASAIPPAPRPYTAPIERAPEGLQLTLHSKKSTAAAVTGNTDIKDVLPQMYKPSFNANNLYRGNKSREAYRVMKTKQTFFDILLTQEEKDGLSVDIHSQQDDPNYFVTIQNHQKLVRDTMERLLTVFNMRFEAYHSNTRQKPGSRSRIQSLTWNNILEKWPKVRSYENDLRSHSIASFMPPSRAAGSISTSNT